MKEKALVLFTVLGQMAAGAFWTLGALAAWAAQRAGPAAANHLVDPLLWLAGGVMAAALGASFFHLGSPWKAYRAVTNLRSSWLSREILAALVFSGLGAVFALLHWQRLGPSQLRSALAWAAALSGTVMVYSMARVYMRPTLPRWNRLETPLAFFTTAFLLGGLGIGSALVVTSPGMLPGLLSSGQGWAAWVYVLALLIEGAVLGSGAVRAPRSQPDDLRPRPDPGFAHRRLHWLRIGLLLGSALALIALISTSGNPAALALAAFLLVLAEEALGRYEFYVET